MAEIVRSVKALGFLSDQMAVRRWMFDIIRDVSARFGYQEYEGPVLNFWIFMRQNLAMSL